MATRRISYLIRPALENDSWPVTELFLKGEHPKVAAAKDIAWAHKKILLDDLQPCHHLLVAAAAAKEEQPKMIKTPEESQILGAVDMVVGLNAGTECYFSRRSKKWLGPIYEHEDCMMGNLVVDNPWRRYGIGSDLLKHAIQIAKNENMKRFFTEIGAHNDEGLKLLINHGFQHVEEGSGPSLLFGKFL